MAEKIVLGLGNNIDYEIVWDSRIIEALIDHYAIRNAELSIDRAIASERDLVCSILAFMQTGGGGERFVAASAIVEQFAQRFTHKVTLGGTSVRAAIAMRKLGHTSALHLVTMNEHVRRLIPADSPYVCSNARESSHPHLIVQFGSESDVRAGDIAIRPARANRIIYHNDTDNIVMRLHEGLGDLVAEAELLLVSGFNAMQDESLLRDRLGALARIMAKLPARAQVYYEDGGFYNPDFSRVIWAALADQITIYSLNEDELQGHLGCAVDLLNPVQMQTALADLQGLIGAPVIVVHSTYWALAYGENAGRMADALKGGITMATTRYCHGDDFTVEDYAAVAQLPPNQAGARFADELTALLGERVCCLPVAQVAPATATTIGLGDAFVGGFLPALLSTPGVRMDRGCGG